MLLSVILIALLPLLCSAATNTGRITVANGSLNFGGKNYDDSQVIRVLSSVVNPEDVKVLDLFENRLTKVPPLSRFRNIETLTLHGNLLTNIQPGCFAGFASLRVLRLNDNKLERLHVGCFMELVGLEKLWLDRNRLSVIELGAFAGLVNLIFLNLSGNHLTRIQVKYFSGLPALHTLKLDSNRLETLEDGCFDELKNLKRLGLSINPLTKVLGALGGLSHLEFLDLYITLQLSPDDAKALKEKFEHRVRLDSSFEPPTTAASQKNSACAARSRFS